MRLNKKGFTLVELLVTIVIVGLVIGFSVFGIISLINNSKNKVSIISENNLKEAARIYSSEASNSSWKKGNDFDAFCVTINELMNKGLLDKNATIQDGISKNTYIIVKRNKVTLAVNNEEIIKEKDENYRTCTNTSVNEKETITSPIMGSSVSYTDKIIVSFTPGSAKYNGSSSEVSYKCLYGESSSNLNREGTIVGNSCVLEGLINNYDYYIAIYMSTNNGSSVLAEGKNNYKTSDFNAPTISQNKNIITINYNDIDTNGNSINNPSHYFKSTVSGITNVEVKKCVLKNNIFTCDDTTTSVQKDTWYKVEDNTINITYPEENNKIKINARIYDKSNNYKDAEEEFIINKYVVKFYRNTAKSVDNSTNTYIEKYCIAISSESCIITSPSIVANAGYNVVGWSNNKDSAESEWNVNTQREINSNLEYYAITNANSYTYNIVYKSSSGKQLGTGTITHAFGTTNTVSPKSFSGYTSPSSQEIKWDSTSAKTITFVYTPISYKITYTLNGGTLSTSNKTSYTIETATFTLSNPTKTGYTFKGWTGTNGTTAQTSVSVTKGSTGNRSYTANWTAKEYTYNIVYKSSSGIELGTATIKKAYGTTNTVSPKSFSGYTSPSSQEIKWDSTSAKTITFVYTPISYKITYTLNGGTLSTSNRTSYTIETATFTLNNPTKTGYTFKGWTGTNGTTAQTSVTVKKGSTGNRSYTANWTAKEYTYNIVYKSSSGIELGTATIKKAYGTTNTVSPKSFSGYTSPSSQEIKWDSTSAKTITFVYTPISYKITYTLNGGTLSTSNKTSYTIETATFTLNNPTKTGYTFDGWTGTNGTTAQTSVTVKKGSTGNRSYTANWIEDSEVIDATKFTCEGENRLAVLHVTTCTGNNCIYDTKNGLDSSYDFSTDQTTPDGPTWEINKSNYVDNVKDKTSITTNGNTCKRVVRYVNNTNGLNCRTSVDTSKDNVKKKFSDCAAINVYRSTWKSSGGYNYYYSSTYGCFVSVGYLSTTKPSRCTTSSTPTMAEKCADACGDLNSCWNGELSKCYCCASENTPCNLIGGVQSCHTVTIS